MAEVTLKDKIVDQIPRFVIPEEKPAEAPKEEPKPVADAATPEPETPQETPDEVTTEKEPEKQPSRRFERRIDRAHKRAMEAEARAEAALRELQEMRQKSQPAQEPLTAPKLENFSDVAEYEKAVSEYHKQQARQEFEREHREAQSRQQREALANNWREQVDRGASKYDDFDEVVGDIKPTTPWAIAIMNADNGDEIAYYLGTHEKEVQKIVRLDPINQMLAIGRLSHQLTLKPEAPKKPSAAPPPIQPVSGGTEGGSDDIKPNMSPEEYMRIGNKMFRGG